MTESIYRVRIEVKRVQTFLFEVPRLRAMVGANVLLGELLRYELTNKYLDIQRDPPGAVRQWSKGASDRATDVFADPLDAAIKYWRLDQTDDPEAIDTAIALDESLKARFPSFRDVDWLSDCPARSYEHGVLAREGGHFTALFDSLGNAKAFVDAAADVAARQTPGIRLQAHIDSWAPNDPSARKRWKEDEEPERLIETLPFQLPVFERCPELPHLPVDDATEYWDGDAWKTTPLSYPVALRYRYGKRYVRHESVPERERPNPEGRAAPNKSGAPPDLPHPTLDMASLMRPQFPMWRKGNSGTSASTGQLPHAGYPRDFKELTGNGYMAVIHIDGNAMGKRTEPLRKAVDEQTSFDEWLTAEFSVEGLFHQSRVLMRSAVAEALTREFGADSAWTAVDGRRIRPYQVLMLGGDDLLLVCRADRALPFVVKFCKVLQEQSKDFPAFASAPLTIGAGVVIAKPSLPFHRLHELAEGLASSAKELYRARVAQSRKAAQASGGTEQETHVPPEPEESVVDWMITTSGWAEDTAVSRAQSSVVAHAQRRLVLSRRPCLVLTNSGHCSLEDLLQAATTVSAKLKTGAARSQLKGLQDDLLKGESLGRLAWMQLPVTTRSAMVTAGVGSAHSPWDPAEELNDGITYVPTRVLDVVELVEISSLAQQTRWKQEPEDSASPQASAPDTLGPEVQA